MAPPTRRDVLQAAGGAAALGAIGTIEGRAAGGNGGDNGWGGDGHAPPTGRPFPNEEDPRYLVGVTSKDAMNMVRGVAREVLYVYDWGDVGWTVLGRFEKETRRALERRPRVRYVEVDRFVEPYAELDCDGTDPSSRECTPWGIDRIDADVTAAGDSPFDDDGTTETGSGADVTIIDTGIDAVHDDLTTNPDSGTGTFTGWDGSTLTCHCDPEYAVDGTCHTEWDDDNGHGSHVGGTVGALGNDIGVVGAGPDIRLHAAKVLHGDFCAAFCNPVCTACPGASETDCNSNAIVAAAIKWAADQGHDVANLSLGGGGEATVIRDALSYAYFGFSAAQGEGSANRMLVVASAGNPGSCDSPHGDVGYPAAFNFAVAVSATRHDDDLALYSATGPEVEIAAPGGSAWDPDTCDLLDAKYRVFSSEPRNDYGYKAGTSMAAPHVSGVAALLIDIGMDPLMAREQLGKAAEDLGLSSDEQGQGLVDPATALELDSSDDGTNTLDLTVVRGHQERIDSDDNGDDDTARLTGWWSGADYAADDIDAVGFAWREFDPDTGWGGWTTVTSTDIPTNPPKFTHDITMQEVSDGCFAYQYYATVEACDGTTATSRRRAFWNDTSC